MAICVVPRAFLMCSLGLLTPLSGNLNTLSGPLSTFFRFHSVSSHGMKCYSVHNGCSGTDMLLSKCYLKIREVAPG